MGFWETIVGMLFLIICVLLIVVVLLQKGRGGGLGAAFGGVGSSAFGTRVGDVFTWVTIVLTALFLLAAIGASLLFRTPPSHVLSPVFVPSAQAIEEPIGVELRSRTDGSYIHFTVDGSEPTEKSPAYEKALKVEPGTTIRARAFRKGWEPSEEASASYPLKAADTQPATAPETQTAPADTQPATAATD